MVGLLEDHREFVTDERWRDEWFDCKQYGRDFISFVEDQVDENVCPGDLLPEN